ncbi:MAG: integration host factor subunit beta [Nitrospirae bacterium]|nr:integration host factor subunit beta [Nitrospirota bacterium]
MTRSELIELVTQRTPGLTRVQTEIIVEAFFQSIIDALTRGEKIEVRGFGNFRLTKRSPRKARNPKTGEIVDVPAKNVLHFKMGKELRELINKQR